MVAADGVGYRRWPMRAPVATIPAPSLPRDATWLNVATLRMDQQRGRPVLVEFFDVCRVHSLRTLPYVRAWHERYAGQGLRVISVQDPDVVREAVARLGVEHAVVLDPEFRLWQEYENQGWPARYLFGPDQMLAEFHYGQGAYAETELVIQELLGIDREPVPALRPEDEADAVLAVPTPDQEGPYSGPYAAGAVWGVLEGTGAVRVGGREVAVPWTGCHLLVEHDRHTEGVLELEVGDGVTCHGIQFEPGLVG
jgi:hypothetical protein